MTHLYLIHITFNPSNFHNSFNFYADSDAEAKKYAAEYIENQVEPMKIQLMKSKPMLGPSNYNTTYNKLLATHENFHYRFTSCSHWGLF